MSRAGAALSLVLLAAAPAAAADAALVAPAARKPLPSLEVKTLDGGVLRPKSLLGKPFVLSFWATWCSPCQQELTALQALGAHTPELTVVAINTDGPETRANVRSVVQRKKWTNPIGLDAEGSISAQLNPRGAIPFTIFVDRQGRIAYVHPGYQSGDEARYGPLLVQLVAEAAP